MSQYHKAVACGFAVNRHGLMIDSVSYSDDPHATALWY
jgi:hypothetical protein